MEAHDDRPRRIGYGDPPYPGMARRWYGDQPDYAGEVDHVKLIERLRTFDGWALSTSAKTLRQVLLLCPDDVRVASWVKPNGVSRKTRGPHNTWEPVIYVPARYRCPGVRDWLRAKPARGGGTLPGRKPRAFWLWLFQLLGMAPGDEFADFFPGSGGGDRHWRAVGGALRVLDDGSPRAPGDDAAPGPHVGRLGVQPVGEHGEAFRA